MLKENEVFASAVKVKYHDIEYCDKYIVLTQNRTRRRVYNGYYFEDFGSCIHISTFCADMFQHGRKVFRYIVNTVTKEWRKADEVLIERNIPKHIEAVENNEINQLKRDGTTA